MTEKMKTTAPVLSVGADREQPNTKNHKEIIANETAQINLQAAQNPEKSRSGGLQIVSMTELYDIHRERRLWTGFSTAALTSL
mgnify:CR=1 FL=1